jgi:hypothetical protein
MLKEGLSIDTVPLLIYISFRRTVPLRLYIVSLQLCTVDLYFKFEINYKNRTRIEKQKKVLPGGP